VGELSVLSLFSGAISPSLIVFVAMCIKENKTMEEIGEKNRVNIVTHLQ
jgi:hypothetical protein